MWFSLVNIPAVPNAPFSATTMMDNTQTLADGATVTTKTMTTIARDSKGRTHNENRYYLTPSDNGQGRIRDITIFDPTARIKTTLTPATLQAAVSTLPPPQPRDPARAARPGNRPEDLGWSSIDGLIVHGFLESRTIPQGADRNDRPLTITDEYWYSDELHMNITLRHTDPRYGTQFVTLTQLSRDEPDEKMFQVPAEYKVRDDSELIPALKKECGIVKMVRARQPSDANGGYKTAETLCASLEAPAGSSDEDAEARTAHDLYQLLARMNLPPATAADRYAALVSAAAAKSGLERFYALVNLAKVAFETGNLAKATAHAQELLRMAPQFPKDWNYGNAIYYGHFVLGRVALRQGNTNDAASQLLAAGATPGSPQLNSFGPNLTLAKDLLAQGQAQPVLEYLAACKSFWKLDYGKLDEWIGAIRAGVTPDFSSNLNY
ncbi:MAG: hypothetical protein ABSF64_06430 [Bryobacteraceae bacterium]